VQPLKFCLGRVQIGAHDELVARPAVFGASGEEVAMAREEVCVGRRRECCNTEHGRWERFLEELFNRRIVFKGEQALLLLQTFFYFGKRDRREMQGRAMCPSAQQLPPAGRAKLKVTKSGEILDFGLKMGKSFAELGIRARRREEGNEGSERICFYVAHQRVPSAIAAGQKVNCAAGWILTALASLHTIRESDFALGANKALLAAAEVLKSFRARNIVQAIRTKI